MPRKRHTPDQIIRKLREAESYLAAGDTLSVVCNRLEVSVQTYYRWQRQYGGLQPDQQKHLITLEAENKRLRRLVADQALDNQILKEALRGKV